MVDGLPTPLLLAPSRSQHRIALQEAGDDIELQPSPERAFNDTEISWDLTIGVSSSALATRVCCDTSESCI